MPLWRGELQYGQPTLGSGWSQLIRESSAFLLLSKALLRLWIADRNTKLYYETEILVGKWSQCQQPMASIREQSITKLAAWLRSNLYRNQHFLTLMQAVHQTFSYPWHYSRSRVNDAGKTKVNHSFKVGCWKGMFLIIGWTSRVGQIPIAALVWSILPGFCTQNIVSRSHNHMPSHDLQSSFRICVTWLL